MTMTEHNNNGLRKLMEEQLQDLYYVEKQLVKALPKMAKAARNDDLREAIEGHLKETEGQVERLEKVFDLVGRPARAKRCPAMDGILEEAKELMTDFKESDSLDAGIIDGGQKVEHYEIATYGSVAAWAEQLGMAKVAALLNETLEEEKAADKKLSEVSESVNEEALMSAEAEEEEEEEEEEQQQGKPSRQAGPQARNTTR